MPRSRPERLFWLVTARPLCTLAVVLPPLLALALGAFALGLPASVLIKAWTPGFFARQDTATPVKVAVVAMTAADRT